MDDVHFSSESVEWGTPQDLFDAINKEWGPFTLDPAASAGNNKVEHYYTKEMDGLVHSWFWEDVFMNPPYGKEEKACKKNCKKKKCVTRGYHISEDAPGIGAWMKKVSEDPSFAVCVIPSRTDTQWFQQYVFRRASEIYFIEGRLEFVGEQGVKTTAPFPSVIAIYEQRDERQPKPTIGIAKKEESVWAFEVIA